jgi:hypothetical protein
LSSKELVVKDVTYYICFNAFLYKVIFFFAKKFAFKGKLKARFRRAAAKKRWLVYGKKIGSGFGVYCPPLMDLKLLQDVHSSAAQWSKRPYWCFVIKC